MVYFKLDEKEKKYIEQASDRTITNYEIEGDFIPVDALMSCIEDLLAEVDYLEERVEDLKEEMRELRNGYNDRN
jgi:DNA gyrase/topoisomerase IV subunit A